MVSHYLIRSYYLAPSLFARYRKTKFGRSSGFSVFIPIFLLLGNSFKLDLIQLNSEVLQDHTYASKFTNKKYRHTYNT